MRAVTLKLKINGLSQSYSFVRFSGSDDKDATYQLVLNDFDQKFPVELEYKGTINRISELLVDYLYENKIQIMNIAGDDELKRILRAYIKNRRQLFPERLQNMNKYK